MLKNFKIMKLTKKHKKKSKLYESVNCLIQSADGVLLLGEKSTLSRLGLPELNLLWYPSKQVFVRVRVYSVHFLVSTRKENYTNLQKMHLLTQHLMVFVNEVQNV